MASTTPVHPEERRVRARIESWAAALRAKDVGGVLSHYTPDALSFDLAPPLQHAGVEALRKGFEWWFPTWVGPIGYEIRDLHVVAGDPVAFAHALARIHGSRTDGDDTDVWVRLTTCLRRIDGEWRIVHEHGSVPFYMDGSLRAAVDLKP